MYMISKPGFLDLVVSASIVLQALLKMICRVSCRLAEPHPHFRLPPIHMHVALTRPFLFGIHKLHVKSKNDLTQNERRLHESKADETKSARRLALRPYNPELTFVQGIHADRARMAGWLPFDPCCPETTTAQV